MESIENKRKKLDEMKVNWMKERQNHQLRQQVLLSMKNEDQIFPINAQILTEEMKNAKV